MPTTRRQLLCLAACLPVLALPGCTRRPARLDATFLQPWRSHIDLSHAEWLRRITLAKTLGCSQLILQWTGEHGGSEPDWQLPDRVMHTLLDITQSQDMTLRIGLPFDRTWWAMLGKDAATRAAFFSRNQTAATQFMRQSPWSHASNFAGWYIPYELEQFHWPDTASQTQLAHWLATLAEVGKEAGQGAPAISTYHSQLATTGTLTQLWQTVLARTALRPMVQDGVGVAGWDNLNGVEPLLKWLRNQRVPFDVVVELFEQVSSAGEFKARSADFPRVNQQLDWAASSGAQHTLGFAVDPWVSADTPEAHALRQHWLNRV